MASAGRFEHDKVEATVDKKTDAVDLVPGHSVAILDEDYEGKPTDQELATLRRVPGKIPTVAYLLCVVEFCERASYYGCAQIWTNYINRPLPPGGNGYGAVAPGSQSTQGALGMGEQIANATTQSFSLIAYCLPLVVGYLADARFGRYPMIFWGVIVCGIGHILIVAGGAKELISGGTAKIPFFLGVYILAVGAAMFKPCVTPLLLDQMASHVPKIKTLKSGERVIEDPEHSTERVMLWFYLLINIGAFMSTATSYSARYVGWWLAFLLPLILYLPLPLLLIWLKPRLILHRPGGSDLPNSLRVIGHCLANGGIFRIGRTGWWESAKPSVRAQRGLSPEAHYSDEFVVDVQRAMQATGMFCFFPVQYWNDNGIGSSANFLGTMLTNNGVPNDVIGNFNTLSIIVLGPILNYVLYPALRKSKIHYGPIARIVTGFFLSTLAGIGYCVLCYKAYETSPCGWYGSTDPYCIDNELVSPISLWWEAIPYTLGGFSELFINVPAYGIAYSRAPVNMRGLVSAINLFNTGFAYIVSLAASAVIVDPYLVWDFGGPAIVGGVVTVAFWFIFRHIDKEEYVLSTTQTSEAPEAEVVEGAVTSAASTIALILDNSTEHVVVLCQKQSTLYSPYYVFSPSIDIEDNDKDGKDGRNVKSPSSSAPARRSRRDLQRLQTSSISVADWWPSTFAYLRRVLVGTVTCAALPPVTFTMALRRKQKAQALTMPVPETPRVISPSPTPSEREAADDNSYSAPTTRSAARRRTATSSPAIEEEQEEPEPPAREAAEQHDGIARSGSRRSRTRSRSPISSRTLARMTPNHANLAAAKSLQTPAAPPAADSNGANGKSTTTNGHLAPPSPSSPLSQSSGWSWRDFSRSPSPLGLIPIHRHWRTFVHKHEVPRKALHVSIGFFVVWLYTTGTQTGAVAPYLMANLVPIATMDLLRHRYASVNRFYVRCLGALMRESEFSGYNGVIWYLLGAWAVLYYLPKDVGVLSVLLLSWCDTAASTFGRLWGRYTPRLRRGKSLAGSLAAFLVGLATSFFFYGWLVPTFGPKPGDEHFMFQGHLSLPPAVTSLLGWERSSSSSSDAAATVSGTLALAIFSLWNGFAASASEVVDIFGWDDNLTIPVLSGIGIWGFLKLFG